MTFTFHYRGVDSILGQQDKIPHTSQPKNQNKTSNVVASPIKFLEMAHIQKKRKKSVKRKQMAFDLVKYIYRVTKILRDEKK